VRNPAVVVASVASAALTLAACASTISGHGTQGSGAPTSSASSASSFPSSSAPSSAARGSNASLSATELERAAKRALTNATAFHMKGAGTDNGAPLGFDVHYGASSSDGAISFSGLSVQLRYVAPDIYMKGGEAFWRQAAGIGASASASDRAKLALLRDKWVHLPPNTPGLSQLGDFAIRSKFLAQAASSPENSTFSKGPSKIVNGVAAVSFVDDSDGTVIYVPAEGTPYPIRIEDHSTDGGSFDLTDWDVPFTAPRPPAAQIVELPH
jgi:predicted small secreted protein